MEYFFTGICARARKNPRYLFFMVYSKVYFCTTAEIEVLNLEDHVVPRIEIKIINLIVEINPLFFVLYITKIRFDVLNHVKIDLFVLYN